MAHNSIRLMQVDGSHIFISKMSAETRLAAGTAVKVGRNVLQALTHGSKLDEWQPKQSGRCGPTVMQLV